jgi:RNA polymerase sigma-70 factor (family 1)
LPTTPLHNEKELLSLLKRGDQKAFTQLYHLYSEPLYLNLLKLLKSKPLAEEKLQEIFILLWEKRETINIRSGFSSYLYRIGENKVIDFFREAKRDRRLYEQLKAATSEQYLYPERDLYNLEYTGLLQKALATLPPQRKRVFEFCKLQGKSYHEVSQLLGMSSSTINDHIVKATHSIRQFMFTKGD